MSLIFTLASRNLIHDRLRFVATVVGIVFSIVLVTVQMGLYLGFGQMVTKMIDHASADLWIMAVDTKSFEDPALIDEQKRFQALAVNGVARAVPVVIGFADWRAPSGGSNPVFVVGSDMRTGALPPWNLVQGSLDGLSVPGAVAIDQAYFDRLSVKGIGGSAEIRGQKVQVGAVSKGIRSFTTTPYVFAPLERARAYTGIAPNKASYFLVRVAPGADVESVRDRMRASLTDVEVLTKAEFRERSRLFWLFGTGAGFALFAGALLGAIVGTVIVAQTLYSSTKDHLNEFATLRAIGSSSAYIYKIIGTQAAISAVIGYILGMGITLLIVASSENTALTIVMTPGLAALLLMLTVGMCSISAISAIAKVMKIDPAMVFTR